MTDIATVWSLDDLSGDWIVAGTDLQSGDDLVTAVVISLFTDAEADADDVIPDGTDDPRGWVGDADSDRPIGSKLWLLSRTTLTAQTLLTAADYMRAALQWLLDDGVVSMIDVSTSRAGLRRMDALIKISRTGGPPVKLQYAWVWGS